MRPLLELYVESSVQSNNTIKISISDEPSLKEALNTTLGDQELWYRAIDQEFASLDEKMTWEIDNNQ